ncbi:Zn-ribbon domain-containing OB-fold protein [Rhodococcus globerulus]|uniref:Zn-ribbon domain-containing OB-fold protein n=1 Tax=Rhodococcus globerulus TaxID=33008 RepID=UPI001F213F0C|nr:OB-fold domain-containing protein [Rhodococcus globerulus]MCE4267544.1 OB-fold domain-containing protein [Rhodococcus globerulus]
MNDAIALSALVTEPVHLQICTTCGAVHAAARLRCAAGADHQLARVELSGRGTVYSWTVTHVPMNTWAKGRTPYVTVLVELDEGVRLMAHLDGEAESVNFGVPVRVSRVIEGQEPFLPNALVARFVPTDVEES